MTFYSFSSHDLFRALSYSTYCAASLVVSHTAACLFVACMDLTGSWAEYAIDKRRIVTWRHYARGLRSFYSDMVAFVPIVAVAIALSLDDIADCADAHWVSICKTIAGYALGKLWSYFAHLALHSKRLYPWHRRHHAHVESLVASHAWLDSWFEYVLMEIPSFCIAIIFFPTHLAFHILAFTWHGVVAAGDHSGFKPAGFVGAIFDGEYHYVHHRQLHVNFAEIEALDWIFGTQA